MTQKSPSMKEGKELSASRMQRKYKECKSIEGDTKDLKSKRA